MTCSCSDAVQHDEQQLNLARHHHRRYHRCPAEFTYSPATGTCYLLRGEQVTWDVADRHCRRIGVQLMTIQSSTEQRQLAELARTNSGQCLFQSDFFCFATAFIEDKLPEFGGIRIQREVHASMINQSMPNRAWHSSAQLAPCCSVV